MTRRENTNNLGQYIVLDIRHTIYGSMCGFSHDKLKNYVCFFSVVCVSKRWYLLSHSLFSHMTGSDVIFPTRFFLTEISFVTFFLDFAWFSVRQTLKYTPCNYFIQLIASENEKLFIFSYFKCNLHTVVSNQNSMFCQLHHLIK